MPPVPSFLGGEGGLVWVLVALVLIGAVLWRPIRAVGRAVRSLAQMMEDWHGTPDRTDRTGAVIERGRPGVPALLETVRSQVQNSHRTNLRDDLDQHAERIDQLKTSVETLTTTTQEYRDKLDEHIVIAKVNDRITADTAEKVDHLVAQLSDSPPPPDVDDSDETN